ncbi:MAG: hypothetical protein ACKVZ0_20040 [Gemmatimonadales bacterium]
MIIRLIPKIFFDRMSDGLDLFVDGLGFTVRHHAGSLAVVERDGAKAYLVESPADAAKDRPEIALETDAIDDVYAEISAKRPDLLHPNSRQVAVKPWGSREFALLDKTGVCVVFRQW